MQSRRILRGTKESRARYCFRRSSLTVEVPKEVNKSLDEYKGVGHDELLEILSSMEDNHYHGTIVLHDFGDHFLHNESIQDYNIQRFLDWNSRMSSFEKRGTSLRR